MRQAFLLPWLLAAALGGCGTGKAATNDPAALPALTGRVVDNADLVPARAEANLTQRLAALEKNTSDQLVVVTVRSLAGESIEDFSLRLGNGWGIGRKELNNGVLLVVAPTERRVRIEVGTGLEGLLTNEKARLIIDERLLPLFAAGRHAEAIDEGVQSLSRVLEQDKRRPQRLPQKKAA